MFSWLFGNSDSGSSVKSKSDKYIPEYERDKSFDPSNEWPFNEPLSGTAEDFEDSSGYDPTPGYDD